MRRLLLLLPLLWPTPAAVARSDDEGAGRMLRALEQAVVRALRDAGPSIACILVSRSDDYHKAPYWGIPADPEHPDRLGRFDAAAARKKVPADAPRRARLLRAIAQLDLADPDAVPESYGSGIVVDRTGLVLTNAHVVRNATKVYVRLPGKRGSWADIHASDPRSDLAVLRLLDPPADLRALSLGDGGGVRPGRFVLSLANSYSPGFKANDEPTADWGVVSNLRQRIVEGKQSELNPTKKALHEYGTLIQTDARTTPGCSGGALLDLDGKVIGLTTALAGVRGDRPGGYAIPLDANTRRIIDVLKRGEEVEYGFLGVMMSSAGGGVRIEAVTPGSPADKAGLLKGDYILEINGSPVRENDDLFLLIGMALAGNTVTGKVSRGNGFRSTERPFTARLAKFWVPGPIIASKRPPARFGLRVDHLSIHWQNAPRFRFWRQPVAITQGVVVREVIPGSPADEKKFDDTKVITRVNDVEVSTPADFYREISRAGKSVELTYLTSDGSPATLTLEEK